LAHLKTFATSVQSYVQGIGDVTAADRETLREKWESSNLRNGDDGESENGWGMADLGGDPFDAILGGLGGGLGAELYALNKPAPKVDPYGQPVGVTPRLALVSISLDSHDVEVDIGGLRSLASWSTTASRIFKKTSRRGWKTNAESVRLMYVEQASILIIKALYLYNPIGCRRCSSDLRRICSVNALGYVSSQYVQLSIWLSFLMLVYSSSPSWIMAPRS
jgi:hypothetical protein